MLYKRILKCPRKKFKELDPWRKRGPVGKLRNMLKYISWTGQRQQMFEKIQGNCDPAKVYKLVEDQETRWNSSYDMIERLRCSEPRG